MKIQPEDIDARANQGVERPGSRREGPTVATIRVWHVGLSLQSDPACAVVPAPVGRYLKRSTDRSIRCSNRSRRGPCGGLPLVEPDTARLLRSLVIAVTGAKKILRLARHRLLGALMAQALPPDGQLISFEIDQSRAATARANIERAGLATALSVIVGDASRFLHKVAGPFDLIFQDGDKTLYEPLLDRLVDHLRPGGVLVTDNVLWDGEVVEGFITTRQHDEASTAAIRCYNRRLAADARLLTTFLPTGDGVAVSVKLPAPSSRRCDARQTGGGHR